MNLRTIFKVQGIILAINGLAGIFLGTAFFSAAGWEITADMLTLGQIFGLTLLIIGIWAWRIPDALGDSVKSMGMLYSLGGALWTLMIIYHVATGAAGGPTAYVNLVITAVFAVLFYMYSNCLLYTSPSPRDLSTSRMPSSA